MNNDDRRYYRSDDGPNWPAIATGAAIGGLLLMGRGARVNASKIKKFQRRAADAQYLANTASNKVRRAQSELDALRRARTSPDKISKAEKKLRKARHAARDYSAWADRQQNYNQFRIQTQEYHPSARRMIGYVGGGALGAHYLANRAKRKRDEAMYGPDAMDDD